MHAVCAAALPGASAHAAQGDSARRRGSARARAPHPPCAARQQQQQSATEGSVGADGEEDPWRVQTRPDQGSGGAPGGDGGGAAYTVAACLASAGALESCYLTAVKLTGSVPALCSESGGGCGGVLSSVWASWQGVPLSALGAATYAAVAAAAVYGATQRSQGTPESLNPARLPLLAGATTLAGVSAYLLLLLATQLQGTTCPYCLTSAALSAGTLACALRGVTAEDRERLGTPSIALAAAVVVTLAVPQSQAAARQAARDAMDLPFAEPEVTQPSTSGAVALAQHLSRVGARMYGAFWCSHCAEQKELFGAQAARVLPYEECFPTGYRKGVTMADACAAQHLEGFPTWVFPDGTKLEGDQSLEKLARLSGFTGSLD